MEKEFVLPEYWYIKITDNNREFIQKWRKLVFNSDSDISKWNYINCKGARGAWPWEDGFLKDYEFMTYVYNPLFNTQPLINEDCSYLIPFIQKLEIL